MKCPSCGTETAGKFCPECGTPLGRADCQACKAPLIAGARFCTQCGARVRGRAGVPAYLIGGTLLAISIVVLLFSLRNDQTPVNAGATAPDASAMGAPPPLTGTPLEQADRLFNRIMQERQSGDTARARFFLPMAITAYENAAPLDADGLYHLSVLKTYSGDAEGGGSTAEQIIAADPVHLLGLHAAASAAVARNDRAAASRYFQRLLDAYPTQRSRDLPEYRDHAGLLPELETEARAFLRK